MASGTMKARTWSSMLSGSVDLVGNLWLGKTVDSLARTSRSWKAWIWMKSSNWLEAWLVVQRCLAISMMDWPSPWQEKWWSFKQNSIRVSARGSKELRKFYVVRDWTAVLFQFIVPCLDVPISISKRFPLRIYSSLRPCIAFSKICCDICCIGWRIVCMQSS